MTDAIEAARRIIAKEKQNKEYPPTWMRDAACVSHALIAAVEETDMGEMIQARRKQKRNMLLMKEQIKKLEAEIEYLRTLSKVAVAAIDVAVKQRDP